MFGGIALASKIDWFASFPVVPLLPHYPLLFLPTRDLTTVLFLLSVLWLSRRMAADKVVNLKVLTVAVAIFSFIPVASFGYSIDRGFYLSAGLLLLSPLLYVSLPSSGSVRMSYLAGLAAGVGAGVLAMVCLLGKGFFAFAQYTFVIMPRYKELMDGFKYPIWQLFFLASCILVAANAYWMCVQALRAWQKADTGIGDAFVAFVRSYREEICLLFLSLFFFRSALGRSDQEHVLYSMLPTYLLTLHIGLKHYVAPRVARYGVERALTFSVVLATLCACVVGVYRIADRGLISRNFPLRTTDEMLIPASHQATVALIKRTLKTHSTKFITMTNEAIWYYYLDEACPIRFPVIWFAATPFYQQEAVDELKRANVGVVLWKSDGGFEKIDGFGKEERLPIVTDYLKRNYAPFAVVGGHELWMRRDLLHREEAAARQPLSP